MTELTFQLEDALNAIRQTKIMGLDWLYREYPKPDGNMRKSITGFLVYEGKVYPVKPLGRLANELAGNPMSDNPITNVFRSYFEKLGFQLINSPENEADEAVERQKQLANIWSRPRQALFRKSVFRTLGARCLISGCETLGVLEAAHIVPFSNGGSDEGWNGIPLRADLHRLFDANALSIDPETLVTRVSKDARKDYGSYHDLDLEPVLLKTDQYSKILKALRQRDQSAE